MGFIKYEMNITESPIEMYSSATELFGMNELYPKVPDNLLHPFENNMMPKINMIYPNVECVFIA